MALTSTDVNNQSFSIDRKGYSVAEVDDFLEVVAASFDELHAEIDRLNIQLKEAREASAAAPAVAFDDASGVSQQEINAREARIQELEAMVAEHKAEDNAIAQALIIAQRSADDIIVNANKTADNTRRDAEDEAQRILDKANAEKQRVLADIRKLEDDREESRVKYADLLTGFINSSQDILSELDRNRQHARNRLASRTAAAAEGAGVVDDVISDDVAYDDSVATYTTPTVSPIVVPAAAPKPSKVEKDFSGFGDTDDGFELDDID